MTKLLSCNSIMESGNDGEPQAAVVCVMVILSWRQVDESRACTLVTSGRRGQDVSIDRQARIPNNIPNSISRIKILDHFWCLMFSTVRSFYWHFYPVLRSFSCAISTTKISGATSGFRVERYPKPVLPSSSGTCSCIATFKSWLSVYNHYKLIICSRVQPRHGRGEFSRLFLCDSRFPRIRLTIQPFLCYSPLLVLANDARQRLVANLDEGKMLKV